MPGGCFARGICSPLLRSAGRRVHLHLLQPGDREFLPAGRQRLQDRGRTHPRPGLTVCLSCRQVLLCDDLLHRSRQGLAAAHRRSLRQVRPSLGEAEDGADAKGKARRPVQGQAGNDPLRRLRRNDSIQGRRGIYLGRCQACRGPAEQWAKDQMRIPQPSSRFLARGSRVPPGSAVSGCVSGAPPFRPSRSF